MGDSTKQERSGDFQEIMMSLWKKEDAVVTKV